MEQLQSHIWLTASSYMVKYLRISSYCMLGNPSSYISLHHAPFWISLHMRTILFYFYRRTVVEIIVQGLQAFNPGVNSSFDYQKQQFSFKFLSSRRISCNDILNFYLFLICYFPVQKYIPKPFKAFKAFLSHVRR